MESITEPKTTYIFKGLDVVESETIYPEDWESDYDRELKLPITKRTFYSPDTQTFVGYQRAKQLKLI